MDFLKEVLIAIGGGAVALIGILTIFKNIFLRVTEKSIDIMFEKKIEHYKNTLNRATTAYELLLKKEMHFYEKIDSLFAELIVVVQDLVLYSSSKDEQDSERGNYRNNLMRYLELIPIMKNEILTHQVYIPKEIFDVVTAIVVCMQNDMLYWKDVADVLFKLTNGTNDLERSNKISNNTLNLISECEVLMKNRLLELSETA